MIRIHYSDRTTVADDHRLYGVCFKIGDRKNHVAHRLVDQIKRTGEATHRGVRIVQTQEQTA